MKREILNKKFYRFTAVALGGLLFFVAPLNTVYATELEENVAEDTVENEVVEEETTDVEETTTSENVNAVEDVLPEADSVEEVEDTVTEEVTEDFETEEEEEEEPLLSSSKSNVSGPSMISIDGDISDWANVTRFLSSDSSKVENWAAAKDDDYLYVLVTGTGNKWNYSFSDTAVSIAYSDGTQNATNQIQFTYGKSLKNGWYQDIAGANIAYTSLQESDGRYSAEYRIPLSYFSNTDFTLSYMGTTAAFSNLTDARTITPGTTTSDDAASSDSSSESEESQGSGVYQGIVIDGSYKDWSGVSKTSPSNQSIDEVAVVWDGDEIYIYLKEPVGYSGNISGASAWGNSAFCLKTDLGRETFFYITPNGVTTSSNGRHPLEGASLAYSAYQYEISVPASVLKEYSSTFDFTMYQGETLVSNIANLNPKDTDPVKTAGKVTFDGNFEDWEGLYQDRIDYTTGGSHGGSGAQTSDGGGRIIYQDNLFYGHVIDYAKKSGNNYQNNLTNFTFRVNGDESNSFMIRAVSRNSDGSFNYHTNINNQLAPGDYEFDLCDVGMWGTRPDDPNIYAVGTTSSQWLGKIYIHVGQDGRMEAEYYLDPEQIAKNLNYRHNDEHYIEANDLQMVEVKHHELGDQWIKTAGSSSGPIGAIAIPMLLVSFYYFKRRKEQKILSVEAV